MMKMLNYKRFEICLVLATWLVVAATVWNINPVEATPTPSPPTATKATCGMDTTNNNNNCPNTVFGVPKSKSGTAAAAAANSNNNSNNPLFHLRGGELHTPETLEEVEALVFNAASNDQLVVIDFTASWCGPCKMIAPIFKELSEEIGDVVFLKVDVDENPETAAKYSVSAMPTFVFVKGGEVVDRLMGADVPRLQALIEEHM